MKPRTRTILNGALGRQANTRDLARQIVDRHIVALCTDPLSVAEADEWADLVVRAKREFRHETDDEAEVDAAFALGLELGRRLGGGR